MARHNMNRSFSVSGDEKIQGYMSEFREIVRTNRGLVILSLLYLLFIVVIPFSTSLLRLYLSRLSVMVYAGLMACAGYMLTFLRIYAERNHRLISRKHSVQSIKGGRMVSHGERNRPE